MYKEYSVYCTEKTSMHLITGKLVVYTTIGKTCISKINALNRLSFLTYHTPFADIGNFHPLIRDM